MVKEHIGHSTVLWKDSLVQLLCDTLTAWNKNCFIPWLFGQMHELFIDSLGWHISVFNDNKWFSDNVVQRRCDSMCVVVQRRCDSMCVVVQLAVDYSISYEGKLILRSYDHLTRIPLTLNGRNI